MTKGADGEGLDPPPRIIPEDGLELRYAARSIWADLARAVCGLVLVLLPFVAAAPPWPAACVLLGLAALFGAFLVQTWRRGRISVRLSEEGIALLPATGSRRRCRRLAWRDLRRVRLRWFGPRRPGAGWLDLELRDGAGGSLSVTSGLARFDLVLDQAVLAAERNGVELEPVSRANLVAVRTAAKDPAGSWAPRA